MEEKKPNETELDAVSGGAPSKDAPMFVVGATSAPSARLAWEGVLPSLIYDEPRQESDSHADLAGCEKALPEAQKGGTIIGAVI